MQFSKKPTLPVASENGNEKTDWRGTKKAKHSSLFPYGLAAYLDLIHMQMATDGWQRLATVAWAKPRALEERQLQFACTTLVITL